MKEILTKDEKEEFEDYIKYVQKRLLTVKREDFTFIRCENINLLSEFHYILRVRIKHYLDIVYLRGNACSGMKLYKVYSVKDLGL